MFAVAWSIYPGPGPDPKPERGVYAPPGGLSEAQAEAAEERVLELARSNGIRPAGEKAEGRQMYVSTMTVPFHDDLARAWGAEQ
jgi:hypothetical protein